MTLEEKILGVLQSAEGPVTTTEIVDAVALGMSTARSQVWACLRKMQLKRLVVKVQVRKERGKSVTLWSKS